MVYRIFVEKKPGLDNEARALLNDARTFLGVGSLEKVRLLNRYDLENITPELFDLAVREADHYLDRIFCANVWPWVLTAITVAFVGITIRYAKTVYSGVKSMRRSRLFPLFACGIALLVFVSQILGHSGVWQSFGIPDSVRFSHFVEESVELFGYALMFVWAVSHTARFMRRKHRSLRDVV